MREGGWEGGREGEGEGEGEGGWEAKAPLGELLPLPLDFCKVNTLYIPSPPPYILETLSLPPSHIFYMQHWGGREGVGEGESESRRE